MTSRRIVLVRHARPEIVEGVPSAEWKLSPAGRDAAAALGRRLRGFHFARVAASPEPKAVGTAEAIAAELGLAVAVDEGFAEHARRSVTFLPRNEVDARIESLFRHPDRLIFGDETADACFTRLRAALDRELARSDGDVLAVTHGTILSVFVSRLHKVDPMPFWRGLGLPVAIVLSDGGFEVVDP